jgi:dUTPase
MKVFFKKLSENAKIPEYAYESDAGADIIATSMKETDKYVEYGCGLAFQIDPIESRDWYFEIFPRSSLSNYDLILCNSVGVIDNSYRGEVKFRFKKIKENGLLLLYILLSLLCEKSAFCNIINF